MSMNITSIPKAPRTEISSGNNGYAFNPRHLLDLACNAVCKGMMFGRIIINCSLPPDLAQKIFDIIMINVVQPENLDRIQSSLLVLGEQISCLQLTLRPNFSSRILKLIKIASNLERLTLSIIVSDLIALKDVRLPKLEALTLCRLQDNLPVNYKKIQDSVLSILKTNPTIISLDVKQIDISYNFLAEAAHFPQLKKLSLNNFVDIHHADSALIHHPHLILTNLVILELTNIKNHSNNEEQCNIPFDLQFLQLQCLTITNLDARDVSKLTLQLCTLTSFTLNDFEMDVEALNDLIHQVSTRGSNLKSLDMTLFTQNLIEGAAISEIITPLGELTTLTSLSLSVPQISENNLKFIEKLSSLRSLKVGFFTDQSLNSELKYFTTNLRRLSCRGSLDFNTNQEVLSRFTNLTFLDCNITPLNFYSSNSVANNLDLLFPHLKALVIVRGDLFEQHIETHIIEKSTTIFNNHLNFATTFTGWNSPMTFHAKALKNLNALARQVTDDYAANFLTQ